ncbi:Fungalysin metallopeptidase-domain-containing protein [Auriculariales sp. MPI-PUGE-AT-0066]|nr:Fungalysin metallopeptidase-domain-containing protein [Auriculariales sp. MPI-PUGE-AT-0066]
MVALSPAFMTLAVLCSSALAAPWSLNTRQHTHRIRTLPNGLRVKSYHPEATYKTFSDGVEPPKTGNSLTSSFKDSALAYLGQELGSEQLDFHSSFEADTAKHVYVSQKLNGFKVANAVAHSTLNSKGKVVAFSSSFVTPQNKPATKAKISTDAALTAVKSKLGATPTGRDTSLEYFSTDSGDLVLSHVIEARVDGNGHLVEAFIDATTGENVGLIDFTTQLTYHVVPLSKQSPEEGLEDVVDPEDKTASPSGWTTVKGTDNKATSGNNIIAYKGSKTNTTASSKFATEWKANTDPKTTSLVDVARTNAFFVANSVHDVSYLYGFNEAGFNFQQDNGSKGGKGNDAVQISVQDAADTDNADMTTPADGSPGAMRMFLWDITNPMRDGALENDIVIHEYTHGITNRLTGGGTGRCLTGDEAGGMGEGWSDAMAFWFQQTSAKVSDYTMGSFVVQDSAGIRSHPYSTSKSVNPYTYATLATKNEVHDIGEIWANLLINVYAALVDASGFDVKAHKDASLTTGNSIWLHLFIDSLALQPCAPTFITARDAWIQADKNRYSGANTCTLWKAFASRGLGVNATSRRVDNADVPAECNGTTTSPKPTSTTTTSVKPTPTSTTSDEPEPTETETPTDPEDPEDPEEPSHCPSWWPFDWCPF